MLLGSDAWLIDLRFMTQLFAFGVEMSDVSVDYNVSAAISLLEHFYWKGGCSYLPSKGAVRGLCEEAREDQGQWMAKDVVGDITERGLVSSIGAGRYQLTTTGFAYLHAASENKMTPATADYLCPDDVKIVSAVKSTQLGNEINLGLDTPADLWQSVVLHVLGTIGGCTKRVPIARVKMLCLDAEPAIYDGKYSLSQIFEAAPDTLRHFDTICNHDLDGEPVEHCYELAELVGFPEAIGRNLIYIEELTLEPGLVGKGIGQRILKKILRRYGKGGGVVMLAMEPLQTADSRGRKATAPERIAARYLSGGFKNHPYSEGYLVGDINICAGLAPAEETL